ncbi:hypothetical protein AVKW3434_02425 [Acidovorax sp. SUPP3434]|uniref:hypothetical protein n=1 Tax=Acidovorax sp. SUPP3434 TaxID=2920880 RepID=UPI0023DE57DD|nr:hypothetical protein [Acidovorax sp. SUPP3434]GKS98195.1 hypothetical protein AVKW3434_02425 [Acidovorax sp. SUPP3434]
MFTLLGPEAQVMLAICAFYGYDACVPLAADAGLLRRGRRGWHGLLATQGFEVRWAYLAWPALLLPHQPVYTLRWDVERVHLPGDARAIEGLRQHAMGFAGFAWPLCGLGATLFVLLPAVLFLRPSEAAQLGCLALIYGFALWIALLALQQGRRGHTPQHTARSVAVQAILCPPFALNAVRKLSAAYLPPCDWLQAAHALLEPGAWRGLAERAQTVVEAGMDQAQAENNPQTLQRLSAARGRLQASSGASADGHVP